MNEPSKMGDMLDVAERYQRTFVKPLVDAVTQQLDQHLAEMAKDLAGVKTQVAAHGTAITKLQADQKKALVGYGVFSSGVAMALAAGWTWVKTHWKSLLG